MANRPTTDSDLALIGALQQRIGYVFNDPSLIARALRHRSSGKNNNERLEFLGDSLVNMVAAELLYELFPEVGEGALTARRAKLVCRQNLALLARNIRLGDALILGQGAASSGGHRLDSILCDTYEALIGALYLDSDWSQVRTWVRSAFEPQIADLDDETQVRDAKSLLQEWLQGKGAALPKYSIIAVTGPGHAREYRVECRVECLDTPSIGHGPNKRAAEQEAANLMLEQLETQ